MKYDHFSMLPEQAFIKVGGQIKPQGGGSSTPTSTTVNQTSVPAYAQPYVESTLGQAQALTSQSQYQPYSSSSLFAGFTPLQSQAMGNISNMQVAPQIQQATDIANQAGNMAGQYGNMGAQSGATGQNLGTQGGAAFGNMGAQAGASYGQNATNPNAVGAYMNPYIQNTLQPAMQLLNQQYGMQGAAEQGAATSKGAFGGSREALMQGLNQQNQNLAQNQLVGNAYNQAYNTANTNMQQAAQLGIAGANAGLQGVNTQLAGTAQGMQGAQTGISGANAQLQAAGTLGQLGQTNYNQEMGINQAQLAAGAQQQQQQQNVNNFNYQQSLNEQNFPYQNLAFMQGMYSGLPLSQTAQQMYQAQPAAASQLIGGAGAALTANAMKGGKTGGLGSKIAGYAGGGIVALAGGGETMATPPNATGAPSGSAIAQLNPLTLPSALADLPTEQIQVYARTVPPGTVAAELVNSELQRRTGTQQSVANIPAINAAQKTAAMMSPNELPQQPGLAGQRGLQGRTGLAAYGGKANFQVPTGAQGGVVAFGKGDYVMDETEGGAALPYRRQQGANTATPPVNTYVPSTQIPLSEAPLNTPYSELPFEMSEVGKQHLGVENARLAATPTSAAPAPATPTPAPNAASPMDTAATEERGLPPTLSPAANAPTTGATTAAGDKISFGKAAPSPAGLGSFADFKSRIADEAQMSPEDKAQLDAMRQRGEAKTARAEKQEGNVVNQSLMQGFLAMMRGRTLAEGVALMADKFGSTYANADQAAQAAREKAEDAKDAHAQYEMALKRGDKKLAADMVEKYDKNAIEAHKAELDYAAKMAVAGTASAANVLTKQGQLMSALTGRLTDLYSKQATEEKGLVTPLEKEKANAVMMTPDPKAAAALSAEFDRKIEAIRLNTAKKYAPLIRQTQADVDHYRDIAIGDKESSAPKGEIVPRGLKQ